MVCRNTKQLCATCCLYKSVPRTFLNRLQRDLFACLMQMQACRQPSQTAPSSQTFHMHRA